MKMYLGPSWIVWIAPRLSSHGNNRFIKTHQGCGLGVCQVGPEPI